MNILKILEVMGTCCDGSDYLVSKEMQIGGHLRSEMPDIRENDIRSTTRRLREVIVYTKI